MEIIFGMRGPKIFGGGGGDGGGDGGGGGGGGCGGGGDGGDVEYQILLPSLPWA